MNTRKTQGYILTFRCVNCGKHEVFSPSKDFCPDCSRGCSCRRSRILRSLRQSLEEKLHRSWLKPT
jgi:hypothetical protein